MNTKVYLEMDYPTTAETQWINRIQSRLCQSSSETLKRRAAAWRESGLGELALVIATRTTVLRCILLNLTREMAELERDLQGRKADVREAIEGGHGMRVVDRPFRLVLFSDAFLFESKAASEFVRDFAKCFFKSIFGQTLSNSELANRFVANEVPIEWLDCLKNERDFLLHNGGTWPILETVDEAYDRFDLVLQKNISYTGTVEEENAIHFDGLREIFEGFQRAVSAIEQWLLEEIREFEERQSSSGAV